MNPRTVLLMTIMPVLAAGCAFGYHAHGTLSDIPGEMRGKAFPGNAQGGGRFMLVDAQGALRCDGEMSPADVSPVPGSCQGESGRGRVQCSDGRVLLARWTAVSCRSIEGEAEDERGNRLSFRVERRR